MYREDGSEAFRESSKKKAISRAYEVASQRRSGLLALLHHHAPYRLTPKR